LVDRDHEPLQGRTVALEVTVYLLYSIVIPVVPVAFLAVVHLQGIVAAGAGLLVSIRMMRDGTTNGRQVREDSRIVIDILWLIVIVHVQYILFAIITPSIIACVFLQEFAIRSLINMRTSGNSCKQETNLVAADSEGVTGSDHGKGNMTPTLKA